ncbi:toxin-antitoxin system HicB family antitoxin [Nakamurella sp.]|uniref:toxin-antitoxin system HicB family antitoxin n=1 Tax=Nakamurella sp. TaxID=1869182 RepID=UPI003783C014
MDLTPYTQSLRDDLITAASVGDDDARRAAVMLAGAIEPAARLAIMNALSDLAAEVTGALRDTTVELKLDGRDVRLSVTEHHGPEPVAAGTSEYLRKPDASGPGGADSPDDLKRAVQDASGELSRTTVRLFNELKSQAERAAADQGVSLNTYISRAVSDSVRSAVPNKNQRGRGGANDRNVTGYIRG